MTEEQRAAMDEIRTSMRARMTRSIRHGIESCQDPQRSQANRLKQVKLQLDGPTALVREDMIEKLNLSEEQVEQNSWSHE